MHAPQHPGGRPAGPVTHQPVPQPPVEPQLDRLREATGLLNRRFITANALCFATIVVLAGAAPGLLATEVVGRTNLGMLLCVGQGVLTLWTARSFDRRSALDCDPTSDDIRDRYEEEQLAPPRTGASARPFGTAPQPFGGGHQQYGPGPQSYGSPQSPDGPQSYGSQSYGPQSYGPGQPQRRTPR